VHHISALAGLAAKVLAEEIGDIGVIVDDQDADADAAALVLAAWEPRGRRIVNSVNSPTRLSTVIVPPCCWVTMSQLIERPSPAPSPVGLVVKNG